MKILDTVVKETKIERVRTTGAQSVYVFPVVTSTSEQAADVESRVFTHHGSAVISTLVVQKPPQGSSQGGKGRRKLSGYGALSHIQGLSCDSYLQQKRIDREQENRQWQT
ncbi:MAG: hypothetical protein HYX78_03785 [Armatimonadetes bacterium]|nr:hypothetical protein [Armatimonadota bacterium]